MGPLGIRAASFHNPLTVLKTVNNPFCLLFVAWLIHSDKNKNEIKNKIYKLVKGPFCFFVYSRKAFCSFMH